jgi:hypothetical protein
VPEIEVQTEEELPEGRGGGRGWRYTVCIDRGGATSIHTVTLSWVDHEFWSGGVAPPSRIVEAVVRFALDRSAAEQRELPEKFDASTVRRWYPEIDEGLVF